MKKWRHDTAAVKMMLLEYGRSSCWTRSCSLLIRILLIREIKFLINPNLVGSNFEHANRLRSNNFCWEKQYKIWVSFFGSQQRVQSWLILQTSLCRGILSNYEVTTDRWQSCFLKKLIHKWRVYHAQSLKLGMSSYVTMLTTTINIVKPLPPYWFEYYCWYVCHQHYSY